ncbi:endo-1,4-beta-xylanase [Cellulomonas sp. S1-8]|uniref:endo-1,4-beta-xylanase n=1 Tax=Cellulomonas sp. S1-8 TaxID=2904790 RepID=UPI0022449308|nr:endo-1,4-beta-xylanase [Cellulomonas sp. S1-8]UZN04021.1 endo-1,4-beta-xylanase [Cellulomonas sp. S1-8]
MYTKQRRKASETIGVGAAVLALVAAPMVGTSLSSARAAEPVTILSADFEDGTANGWTQSGGAGLSYPTDTVLQVADRVEDWDGLTSPAIAVEAGVTYTFSARAKLADGTVGTTSMRFQTGAPTYSWIGNTSGINAAAWTTVTGTWTAPATADELITFSGSDLDGSSAAFTYLVDDLRVTRPGTEAGTTVTVAAADFQTEGRGGWTQSGNPTLSEVSLGRHLQVADRVNGYDGIKSPAVDLEAGVEYTVSARARLAAGTVGTAGFRFVTDPGYDWVGNTTIDATGWTTVTGTYTPTADTMQALFLGTDDLVGGSGAYTYQVDDIRVTRPAPEEEEPTPDVTTVAAADFDDSTLGDLRQSGTPTLGYVPEGDGMALSVTGRGQTWHTVESATGIFASDVEYTFSARVRLLTADADAVGRFTLYDGSYTPVGPTPLSTGAWTTVTGTYTVPAGVDASTVKFAVEAGSWAGSMPDYLVDDVLVTRAAGDEEPVDPEEPVTVTVLDSTFESGTAPWAGRGAGVTVARTTTDAHGGTGSLLVTGRSQNWHGTQTAINPIFAPGGTYAVSAWVKLAPGEADTTIKMTVAEVPDAWIEAAPAVAVTDDAWVQVSGTYTRGAGVTGGDIYFEAAGVTTSFLVDDVVFVGPAVEGGDEWVPDLEGFVPGGAVNPTTTPVTTARTVEGATNTAALTFDDGPNGADTAELLDFLAANDVVATFCVIGQNVTAPGGAATLQRIVSEGHTLCNHGTTYADMGAMSKAEAEADMKANLALIRTALGDDNAQVPYFRAPNGSWGQTAEVAVALGMQPLGVVNTINDWDTQDEATLTANLRTAMRNGEIVLVHDGGGNRAGSVAAAKTVIAERLAAGWSFTLPSGGADGSYVPSGSIDADFEDNTLQGWSGRDAGNGAPTVEVVAPGRDSQYAARVSNRDGQGEGLQHNVAGIFEPGATYDVSAWIKFEGTPGDITLSAHVEANGSSSYPNLISFPGMSNEWVQVTGTFTMPNYTTAAEVYFETAWAGGAAGNTSTFLVDDITFEVRPDAVVQDLPSLQSSIDVPFGVAADSRETFRSAAELLNKHFTQLTPENSMKPEAWYTADGTFQPSADAEALMDFAVENDLRVYGHVLVWHAQTPAWFFQDGAGNALPVNDASAVIVRERMRTHINSIAEYMADRYGLFGSDGNPLVAWDVANEVIADSGEYSDGMRRSDWYKYLGEEFLDSAFEYANDAFNGTYAAPGVSHPVELFINDYNSELQGKQQRYYDLIERLLARGVPLDGVGHQFHVSLSLPVSFLGDTLEKFSDLGLQQAVTELDVTTGVPVTEALLVDQGHYYRDAFRAFRAYEDQLFSVTVWGLYDTRSWRNGNGAPLVFDEDMQAKPAYHGIMENGELAPRIRRGNAFHGDVTLDEKATSDVMWSQLPLQRVDELEDVASFQARWSDDHLTVYVEVADAFDSLELQVGDETFAVSRDGSGDVEGVVTETASGWTAVVHLPVAGLTEGDTVQFDLRALDGDRVVGWNSPGILGDLALVEALSTVDVLRATSAPTVDGDVDEAWAQASTVSTAKEIQGTGGATATVRTLWNGATLYVLADVLDPTVDTSSTAALNEDSLEIFLDAGNFKNGPYRYDDTQVRISADNAVTFGTGDLGFQQARVESAVSPTATGYRVEAAIGLLESGGLGTFHGLDFQVNDATDGERTSVRTWADPTGLGYQSTARWGVAQLVSELAPPVDGVEPTLSLSTPSVKAGTAVTVDLAGFTPGDTVSIALGAGATSSGGLGGVGAAVAAPTGTTLLGSVVVAGNGAASVTVMIPVATAAGTYRVVGAVGGDVLAEAALTVTAADAAGGPSGGPTTGPAPAAGGTLATTGAGLGLGLLALLVLLTGTVLLVARRRGHLADEVGRTLRR